MRRTCASGRNCACANGSTRPAWVPACSRERAVAHSRRRHDGGCGARHRFLRASCRGRPAPRTQGDGERAMGRSAQAMGTRAARCGGYWARVGARACWHMACLIGLPHGGRLMASASIDALPAPIVVDTGRTALVIIDMQRDFLEPGGFGETLGNDVSKLARIVAPLRGAAGRRAQRRHARSSTRARAIAPTCRTRRAPRSSAARRPCASAIAGPMGRILIRGEPGHDIIPELYPPAGEPVIDKPGKGAFYQTDLDLMLRNRGIETLLVVRRDDRGVRAHHRARGQRPRLSLHRRRRLLRLLLPGIPRGGPAR